MSVTEHSKIRGFRIIVEPVSIDDYGIRLEETNGSATTPPKHLAPCGPRRWLDVSDVLQQALRESHQPRTSLSSGRRKPITT